MDGRGGVKHGGGLLNLYKEFSLKIEQRTIPMTTVLFSGPFSPLPSRLRDAVRFDGGSIHWY